MIDSLEAIDGEHGSAEAEDVPNVSEKGTEQLK